MECKPTSRRDLILEARGVVKHFPVKGGFFKRIRGWVRAVDGVDLEVQRGKTLGLAGESGCGKSTLCQVLLRLIDMDRGEIFFHGKEIGHLSERDLREVRREMQIVFQDPFGSLNPLMTVGRIIGEGLRVLGLKGAERRERTAQLLEMVGISPRMAYRYPHEFSGGQRQRIGIARALSVNPSFVICDEPVSALDVSIQAQIVNLLMDLQSDLGLSYLFISHDLNLIGYLSDDVAIMYSGLIMEVCPAEELFESPLHPYTRLLLSVVSEVRGGRDKPFIVPEGEPTSPLNPPDGCRFQARCPMVEKRCLSEPVPLRMVSENHLVRCWNI